MEYSSNFFSTFNISAIGIISTGVGFVVGSGLVEVFRAYGNDILMPILVDSWMPKWIEVFTVFNQKIDIRPLLSKLLVLIATLLTLWGVYNYLQKYYPKFFIVHSTNDEEHTIVVANTAAASKRRL